MKLAIVRQRYNPYGGAERFVERALAALAAQGNDITLLTRSWEGAPRQGFRVQTVNPPYARLLGGRAARDRSFASAVRDEMARGDYDLVQSHERIAGCDIFRAGDGIHAAWLAHRAPLLSSAGRLATRFSPFHRALLTAERAMFTHPDLKAVICNSRLVADEAAAHYGVPAERLEVIYNGVDTDDFHPTLATTHRRAWRAGQGIPAEVPLLLFVGSGFARKGLPQLLRALAQPGLEDLWLAVVGADRKLPAMVRLVRQLGLAPRVRLSGPLGDVRPAYGAADAFVLPTHYDPCPNAVLEAMACGLPTLTTSACGAKEWITAENGVVVAPYDQEALVAGLAALCNLAARPACRAAARAAVAPLTLDAMATRLLALYSRLV